MLVAEFKQSWLERCTNEYAELIIICIDCSMAESDKKNYKSKRSFTLKRLNFMLGENYLA
jgi:hypothetical protein